MTSTEWDPPARPDAGRGSAPAPPPRVAFQGELGAFSEEAVHRFFQAATPVPRPGFAEVVAAVLDGSTEYGMLPVENTLHGGVTGAYDALVGADVAVVGEVILPIRHCLLAVAGATIETLERVVSHPVALAQCGRFLSSLADTQVVAVYDTAGAARDVAAGGDRRVAAVASSGAGDRYGLEVLARDIQDSEDNQTRFFVVQRGRAGEGGTGDSGTGTMKTALLCETPNEPGALLRLLEPFAARGINLTKLESRPGPTPWTYRFFLEYAHDDAQAPLAAVAEARQRALSVEVLGTFAGARLLGGGRSRSSAPPEPQ